MLSVLFIAVSACGRSAEPARVIPKQTAGASSGAALASTNSTPLSGGPLETPIAAFTLRFASPGFGEQIAVAAPRVYEVRVELGDSQVLPPSIEVALDGGRPRRLSPAQSAIALGQLLGAGEELSPGEHWLFAAPVLDSGLVPRASPAAPRGAIAQRFSIGVGGGSGSKGVIWLRKPEGTYNGRQRAELILFDAYVFAADGSALRATPVISVRGPGVQGELRLPAPFALAEVPSGDFEVRANLASLAEVSTRFTVNRELGDSG